MNDDKWLFWATMIMIGIFIILLVYLLVGTYVRDNDRTDTCHEYGYDGYETYSVLFPSDRCFLNTDYDHDKGVYKTKYFPFEECTQFPRDKQLCGDVQ